MKYVARVTATLSLWYVQTLYRWLGNSCSVLFILYIGYVLNRCCVWVFPSWCNKQLGLMKFILNLSRQRLQRKEGGVVRQDGQVDTNNNKIESQTINISCTINHWKCVNVRSKLFWIGTSRTGINNTGKSSKTLKCNFWKETIKW